MSIKTLSPSDDDDFIRSIVEEAESVSLRVTDTVDAHLRLTKVDRFVDHGLRVSWPSGSEQDLDDPAGHQVLPMWVTFLEAATAPASDGLS
jgi:hypothetical protein